MSNMIKAYSIRLEELKTIDTHLRTEQELEEKRRKLLRDALPQNEDTFVEGLKALVLEQTPSREELDERASNLIEDAHIEVRNIMEKAKQDAEQLKNEAYAIAQKKGYEDGLLRSEKEMQKLKKDIEDKAHRLQQEYDAMMLATEPHIAQIIASLLEKLTGIVIEDKEEVILYLVSKTLKNLDKCEEYTLRVSKEDFDYISMRKNLLLGAIGREVPLYILEDASLKKNQCLVETELKVINCSLDVQLNNIIMDLKLIGGI